MKTHWIALSLLTVLPLVPSCRRPATPDEPDEAAVSEAERLSLERWQLARERAALAAELAAYERERSEQGQAVSERREEVERQRAELAAREQELADREAAMLEAPEPVVDLGKAIDLGEPEAEWVAEPDSDWLTDPEPNSWVSAESDWIEEYPVEDYGTFYNDLEPHGDWFETSDYGYVWRPTVVVQVNTWRPYHDGRWVWTDCGWTWVSNEPFGWATYHYGRWTLMPGHGWVWVPGHRWAPAWVSWRQGGGNVGWAPLPPECVDGARPIWGSGVGREFGIGSDWYCFVNARHFTEPAARHCFPRADNRRLFGATTNITLIREARGRVFVGGPDYQDICGRLGRQVPRLRLNLDRMGGGRHGGLVSGDRLSMVAPAVEAAWNPLLKPQQLAGRIGRGNDPRRSQSAVTEALERMHQTRQRQRQEAESRYQVSAGEDLREKREQWLERHREQLASAQRERADRREPGAGTGPVAGPAGGARRPAPGAGRAGERTAPPAAREADSGETAQEALRKKQEQARTAREETLQRMRDQAGRAGGRMEVVPPRETASVESDPGETAQEALRRKQEQARTAREETMQRMRDQAGRVGGRTQVVPPREAASGESDPGETAQEALRKKQEQARTAREETLQRMRDQAGRPGEAAATPPARRTPSGAVGQEDMRRRQAEAQERLRQQQEAQRKTGEDAMRQQQEQAAKESAQEAMKRRQAEAQERLRQQQEAQRKTREDAMRQQREQAAKDSAQDAAKRRQAEARESLRQQAAAQQKTREDAMRRQAEQAKQAREEAQRRQQEAAQQKAREDAMRRQAEQAQREQQAREAAQRRQQEAAEQNAREDAMRRQAEQAKQAREDARQRQQEEASRRQEDMRRRVEEQRSKMGKGRSGR